MSHCRTYGSKNAPTSNWVGWLVSRHALIIRCLRPKTNYDSLWTKCLEHAQNRLRSPIEREDILYWHIWRRAIHRSFKKFLLRRFKIIQKQWNCSLHEQRDQIDADWFSSGRRDMLQNRFREALVQRLWVLLEVVRHQK